MNLPTSLEEAASQIITNLQPDEIEIIKKSTPIDFHFTVGRFIRNSLSLWDEKSPMRIHFKQRFDLDHPDDISGIIMNLVWKTVTNQPDDTLDLVEKYKEHWEKTWANTDSEGNRNFTVIVHKDGTVEY